MLYLVSLGLWDLEDMSLKAKRILEDVDIIYLEVYTSQTNIDGKKLSYFLKKNVMEVNREFLEDNIEYIIKEAREKDIAVCSCGDVLSATTHTYFMKIAKENGVKVDIIHGSSIFTAIAKTGLSLYRFGRTVSLPHPKNFSTYPKSPFERITDNRRCSLHTLILLDIGFRVHDALELFPYNIVSDKFFACYGLGSEKERIIYGYFDDIKSETRKWDDKAQCLILPSNMEFYEEEIAEIWKIND